MFMQIKNLFVLTWKHNLYVQKKSSLLMLWAIVSYFWFSAMRHHLS